MDTDTITPHLDESAILHLVDRDASPMELDVWSRHVLGCEACGARLDERRRDSERVRVAVGAIRVPPTFPSAEETMRRARASRAARHATLLPLWTDQRWVRAAAVVLMLLLPLALVSPLRAALVEWLRGWTQVATAPDRAPEPIATPAAAPPAAPESAFTIFFTPRGAELQLTVAERQAAGEIVLTRTTGTEGSVEVRGGADETPLITDAGVSIRNGAGSSASYTVAVPARVRQVRLRIGDDAPVTVGAAELAAGWSARLER